CARGATWDYGSYGLDSW
nr:immunoglobulin heavy chain junction region [Macaca mulatta]MOW93407.1 immunoglobulin heavy chain junction region [Macaca mulatta]MOW93439.1 immunoglobulin heavy chain junction region [Macaca mulatta]MOW93466.1 immunoglobulin heavy chain junction region [Macaca mulatta]MOW93809.1 immunoglobulin heavy chain junction region [Macaca mulatta]